MQKSHPKVVNPRDIAGEWKKNNKINALGILGYKGAYWKIMLLNMIFDSFLTKNLGHDRNFSVHFWFL